MWVPRILTFECLDALHLSIQTAAMADDLHDPAISGRIRDYMPRLADGELAERLRATGAVLIEGARGCGKTQTALRAARSAVRLDRDRAARAAGALDPTLLLPGEHPRLIDEWQLVPDVWNEVRGDVDDHPDRVGRFILTRLCRPR